MSWTSLLLTALPWNVIRAIVMGIIEKVVESTDNDYDDHLYDIVEDIISREEESNPDFD